MKPIPASRWRLRPCVAGQSARSPAALANLERICAKPLVGRCHLEAIALLQTCELAQGDQIVAAPATCQSRDAGFTHHLTKPISLDRLKGLIHELTSKP